MNPQQPLTPVSVVVPAYNTAASLSACVQSLLAQTHPAFEIILVDDGSTDETPDLIAKLAATESRIIPVYAEHRGVAHAFNTGISRASHPYIARMDADDICHPDRLSLQAQALDQRPEIGLVASCIEFGGDRELCAGYAHHVDWTNSVLSPQDIALSRFIDLPFANPAVMFRAALIELHGAARQGDFPEDYEMWLRWMDRGVQMLKLPQKLVVWNDPPTRLTRNDDRYAPTAFSRVKALYLSRWLNKRGISSVSIFGAGRFTRRQADLLLEHGISIESYIDIDPKKIGNIIAGRPVISPQQLPAPGERFVVSYVSNRGARELITQRLSNLGYQLGVNFIMAG